MKLNLENVNENLNKLADEYNILHNGNHFLLDGDLEEMLADSGIEIGKPTIVAKNWKYDLDGWIEGCNEGDYLETIVLLQNNKRYLCQAFGEKMGDGIDYTLALSNIYPESPETPNSSNSYYLFKSSMSFCKKVLIPIDAVDENLDKAWEMVERGVEFCSVDILNGECDYETTEDGIIELTDEEITDGSYVVLRD